jgi:putative transcriptional regulator
MKKEDFSKLVASIKQAGLIKSGKMKPTRIFRYATPNVKKIRSHLHVSQNEFALMIGVSPNTIQNWEQGRREPEGPAKALLRIAEKNPRAIIDALYAKAA